MITYRDILDSLEEAEGDESNSVQLDCQLSYYFDPIEVSFEGLDS